MDGNQRWSKKNKKKIEEGYIAGFNNLEKIINYCLKINIKYITVFALSSENLKRNSSYLIFKIIRKIYKKLLKDLTSNKININIVGEKKNLPEDILEIFEKIKHSKENNLQLNIAFNYGVQYEVKNIIESFIENNPKKINLKMIRQKMYLGNIPDPEILIRTGGFQRLSNFMLLNLSYSDLFFTKTLWPDFSIKELENIFDKYRNIKRNYGL
tara:strand:- start:1644 stop:2279 length:636 start_codon:yes stop_codon:yes gene_type:complete